MPTGAIENFFFAWGAPDDRRDAILHEALAEDVTYRDPRGEVSGIPDLCAYVAQFSANAPDSAAEVTEDREEDGTHHVRVRFHGPWGEQFGSYRIRLNADGRIVHADGVPEASA